MVLISLIDLWLDFWSDKIHNHFSVFSKSIFIHRRKYVVQMMHKSSAKPIGTMSHDPGFLSKLSERHNINVFLSLLEFANMV